MQSKERRKRALFKAVEIVGSQSELARLLGVRQSSIWTWLNVTKDVPAEICAQVEHVTGGAVTRSDLRPDLWPPVRSSTAAE
jgi:DNA-binding transcriptional regulator YdaS (Cro superfamily)